MKVATNPYVLVDRPCVSYPVAFPGEQQSMYFNTTNPFDNTDFANYNLLIVRDQVGYPVVVSDQAGMAQDVITGNQYRIYAIFSFPFIDDGYYKYVIHDTVADQIILISNSFEVINSIETVQNESTRIQYRNSADIYNYGYDALPNFFNEVRIRMYEPDPVEFPFDAEQYKEVTTGEFQVPKFDIDKLHTFETYWFDPDDHEAMAVFAAHKTKFVNEVEMTTDQGNAYTVKQSNPRSNLNKGQIKMYDKDFSTINKR